MKPKDLSKGPLEHGDRAKSNSKLSSDNKDPFWTNCAIFSGHSPEDVSLNHDKYLYGKPEK